MTGNMEIQQKKKSRSGKVVDFFIVCQKSWNSEKKIYRNFN